MKHECIHCGNLFEPHELVNGKCLVCRVSEHMHEPGIVNPLLLGEIDRFNNDGAGYIRIGVAI